MQVADEVSLTRSQGKNRPSTERNRLCWPGMHGPDGASIGQRGPDAFMFFRTPKDA